MKARSWRRSLRESSQVAHSVRVAAVAALLIAVLYAALAIVFDVVDSHRLVGEVDSHLSDRLSDASLHGDFRARAGEVDDDTTVESAPVILWRVDSAGQVVDLSDNAPALSANAWSRSGRPTTATIGNTRFRLRALHSSDGWLVAGQSLADTEHVEGVVIAAESIAGPVLVAAMFLGALLIGLKASGPVEEARRRQLEFTADASHELRTPLSVIEAEVGLALGARRDAGGYRDALERVHSESHRLRRIVDDLLWLARFDSDPPPPRDEPVDVVTIAQGCADRFEPVASSRAIELTVTTEQVGQTAGALIDAPPEWIDRLVGVLVDNACRYAGERGQVRIVVSAPGNRVLLAIEDSGPGIPLSERERLFDRFHRATSDGAGAGLGLAIADAVVRSTGGRWRVDNAPQGGAHMEVSWNRSQAHVSGDQERPVRPADETQSLRGEHSRVVTGSVSAR